MYNMVNFNNSEFGELKVINRDGEPWFVGREISEKLGYGDGNAKSKAIANAIHDHVDAEDQEMLNYKTAKELFKEYLHNDSEFKLNSNGLKVINIHGVLSLISKSRTVTEEYKESFIKFLQDNKLISEDLVVVSSRKEIEFIDMLEKVLEPFNYECIRQYPVLGKYRIDLYIKDINVAIEYDESTHSDYSYEAHEGRQIDIESELGCKFIRVSDNKSNAYNVGLVMKELLGGVR